MLAEIVRALNHPIHPASKLHSLVVINQLDEVDKKLAKSEDFRAVMSRIDTLELTIASWHETGTPKTIQPSSIPETCTSSGADFCRNTG